MEKERQGMPWGAAPHPGREKFSLHPRHVCDVPNLP